MTETHTRLEKLENRILTIVTACNLGAVAASTTCNWLASRGYMHLPGQLDYVRHPVRFWEDGYLGYAAAYLTTKRPDLPLLRSGRRAVAASALNGLLIGGAINAIGNTTHPWNIVDGAVCTALFAGATMHAGRTNTIAYVADLMVEGAEAQLRDEAIKGDAPGMPGLPEGPDGNLPPGLSEDFGGLDESPYPES